MKIPLFNTIDFIAVPFTLLVLYFISKTILRNEDERTRKSFINGFRIRVLFVFVFTAIMQFYYASGDTFRYYISILDMRLALSDGTISLAELISMSNASFEHPLSAYFEIDGLGENHYYMRTTANFTVPKIGTFVSFLFFKSYVSISLVFSFFALYGMFRVYKVVFALWPQMQNNIAFACFFIPTVIFWSSGILKDSLTLGALGVLFGASYELFIKRRKLVSSLLWIMMGSYLLYTIKPYILLIFVPVLVVLLLTMLSRNVKSLQLRRVTYVAMLAVGAVCALLLFQNLTSESELQRYSTDQIFDAIDNQRGVYESEAMQARSGSNFTLGSDDPILSLPLGFVASYFRPFPWEVNSPIMVLNVLESLFFIFLFFYTVRHLGFFKMMSRIFANPIALFCLIFSVLFGMAVGTSTGNFGSLVRYKIPGMAFYVLLFFIVLQESKKKLPSFFKIIGIK